MHGHTALSDFFVLVHALTGSPCRNIAGESAGKPENVENVGGGGEGRPEGLEELEEVAQLALEFRVGTGALTLISHGALRQKKTAGAFAPAVC